MCIRDSCAAALTRPGDEILVEAPTYFLAAAIFRDHGLKIRGVAVDAAGVDVDALERALRAGDARPRAVYVVPRHGNPSGATLARARRAKLVALAAEFDFYVFADDVYHLLDWTPGPRLPRLQRRPRRRPCRRRCVGAPPSPPRPPRATPARRPPRRPRAISGAARASSSAAAPPRPPL